MKKAKPYKPIDQQSDEYFDLIDRLRSVFQKHFAHCESYSGSEVYRFLTTYDLWMDSFWTGEQVRKDLKKFEAALLKCLATYEALPNAVRMDLHAYAVGWDSGATQRFLDAQNRDFCLKSEVPDCEAEVVSAGLRAFAKNPSDFLSALEDMTEYLPEGIQTRNRDFKKWALIEATVEMVRVHEAMNVPEAVDQSGDLYRLLSAVFAVYGIRVNSFRQLYQSWKEHIDDKRDSIDTLEWWT